MKNLVRSKEKEEYDGKKRDFIKKGSLVALGGAAAIVLGSANSNAKIFFSDNSSQSSAGISKDDAERISIALG